jgi:MATE family multidrug resistance protein
MSWGIPATLAFVVFRGYCDGVGLTRVAMLIAFAAVLVNVGSDYVLIYGKLGMPRLGAVGAGWATAIVRWSMLVLIVLFLWSRPEHRRYRFLYRARIPRPKYLKQMLKLGIPIGAGFAMENGAFGMTSLMMGMISTVALAAHQVSLVLAAVAFMIPMGASFAVTTRVGQSIGRGDTHKAGLAGWVGICMGSAVMLLTASVFIIFPDQLATTFTDDPPVVAYATQLLLVAGIFQISDGVQIMAQGALRGMKDTTVPMITNFVSYWVVGIPMGALLAFHFELGGRGLWWGFVIGLTLAAVLHSVRFAWLVRQSDVRESPTA